MAKPSRPIKVCFIGAGRICWMLENDPLRYKPCTHAGALNVLKQANPSKIEFTAIIDPNLQNAQGLKDYLQSPETKIYKSLDGLAETPDVVVIASPSTTHFNILKDLVGRKIKHIVIEKPVAVNTREAAKLLKIYKNSPTHLWPNYERRFHPKYRHWREKLIQGSLGAIYGYRGLFQAPNKQLFQSKRHEGVLLHDTTHLLDLVQFFFGDVTRHSSTATREGHILQLIHTSKTVGQIQTITSSLAFHFEIEILTEKGRLVLGNGFTRFEKVVKSKMYSQFYSYAAAKDESEPTMSEKKNPFLMLYRQITDHHSENTKNEFFEQACHNVQILTNRPRKM